MRKTIFSLTVIAAVVTSATALADSTPTGIEVGLRSGYVLPFGQVMGGSGNNNLSDFLSGGVPLWVDAGYRLNPNIYIGAFFQYSFAIVAENAASAAGGGGYTKCGQNGLSCSANVLLFGANAHYHFMPMAAFDPYVGPGAGYEIANSNFSAGGSSGGASYSGFQLFNVQAGGDYKFMPGLGVGPF